MDGRLVMEQGSIYDLLSLVHENAMAHPPPRWAQSLDVARFLTRRLAQFNPTGRARRNVAHHYDIDGSIYDLFLDADRQYSCAYFADRTTPLEAAQHAKKRHLAAKLALAEGQRVLDIGSGWGGLGLYLAGTTGCDVDGVTLSVEQLKIAEERARRAGLANAVHFKLQDYRNVTGPFDRIVSVGMFEHVGVNHYGTYFRKVRDLLAEDGVAVIHSIGRSEPPAVTNPFIAKYIFPGGYIPALSEVMPRHRALRPDHHRRRDPAAALRRDAQRLARALPRQLGDGRAHPRRAFLPDVGVLSRRLGVRVPLPEPGRVPDPAHAAHRGAAAHPRLHHAQRAGIGTRRARGHPSAIPASGGRVAANRSGALFRRRAETRRRRLHVGVDVRLELGEVLVEHVDQRARLRVVGGLVGPGLARVEDLRVDARRAPSAPRSRTSDRCASAGA